MLVFKHFDQNFSHSFKDLKKYALKSFIDIYRKTNECKFS